MPQAAVRIAYVILAHKLPHQLARLIERIEHPDDRVFIHIDAKQDLAPFSRALEPALGRGAELTPRRDCHWGAFDCVEATVEALRVAMHSDWDYAVLLTGQDYPVKPRASLRARIEALHGALALDARAVDGDTPEDAHRRRCIQARWLRVGERFVPFPNRVVPLPRLRPLPLGLRPFYGSVYWCLPRDAVDHLLRFDADHPELTRYLRRSVTADENYVQLILANSRFADRITGENLRYVDWSAGGSHPKLLGVEDLPALRATDALFARKIDGERTPALLDAIDRELLGVGDHAVGGGRPIASASSRNDAALAAGPANRSRPNTRLASLADAIRSRSRR